MSADLAEEFGSNKTAEVEGVWATIVEGGRVKVARLGNPEAQKAYKKIPRHIRKMIDDGTMGNKQAEDFLCDFISSQLLKDWEGFVDEGKSLGACNRETAKKFLHKYRRFREKVWEVAADEDLFNIAEVKEEAKN